MKKKRIQFFLILFLSLMIITGCAAMTWPNSKDREKTESWIGAHKSKLIKTLGPPSRNTSDGKGGEIIIYEKTFHNLHTQYYDFYVNPKGIIYFVCLGWR